MLLRELQKYIQTQNQNPCFYNSIIEFLTFFYWHLMDFVVPPQDFQQPPHGHPQQKFSGGATALSFLITWSQTLILWRDHHENCIFSQCQVANWFPTNAVKSDSALNDLVMPVGHFLSPFTYCWAHSSKLKKIHYMW